MGFLSTLGFQEVHLFRHSDTSIHIHCGFLKHLYILTNLLCQWLTRYSTHLWSPNPVQVVAGTYRLVSLQMKNCSSRSISVTGPCVSHNAWQQRTMTAASMMCITIRTDLFLTEMQVMTTLKEFTAKMYLEMQFLQCRQLDPTIDSNKHH